MFEKKIDEKILNETLNGLLYLEDITDYKIECITKTIDFLQSDYFEEKRGKIK